MHRSACMWTYMCASMWVPELNARYLSWSLSTWFLETGTFIKPGAHQLGLAREPQGSPALHLPSTRITCVILPYQASYMSAEDPYISLHACLASSLRSEPPLRSILYVNQIKLQLNYLCNTWIRIKLWLSSILYISQLLVSKKIKYSEFTR